MDWFLGSANEAIQHCLEQKALLIVYVHHPDAENNSSTGHFNGLWGNFDKSCLEQLNYVALKLANDSDGFKQFAAIFPTPMIPACYLIGLGGKPLEIITTAEELTLEKLNSSVKKAAELYEQQFTEFLSKSPSPPRDTSDVAEPSTTDHTTDQTTTSQEEELPLDDRVALARQKIAEKRKLDDEKKKTEEHEKELRRIKEGKLMLTAKERAKEMEIREAAEERRRQKQADQATLARLREQIKLDKEARVQKAAGVKNEPHEEKPSTAAESTINKPVATDQCRIQCKFPDGSTLIKQFKSDSPLQVVFDAVREDGRLPGDFFLVQTYPRKQLTEYEKSLLDLGLTPASALLVVSGSYSPGTGNLVQAQSNLSFILQFLYSPVMAVYHFVLSFIGMGPAKKKKDDGNSSSSQKDNQPGPSTSADLRRRRPGNNENRNPVRREGNMARLRNPDDSDDENATWNGNSTQQL